MKFFERIFYLLKKFGLEYLNGTLMTLLLAVVGTLVGLLFGCGLAILRNLEVNKNDNTFTKVVKQVASKLSGCYIQVFRGTPMMVQAMIIYFGGSYLGFEWNLTICGLLIITLNTTAYMAEIVRSGINSVDVGQVEGAKSLGMSEWQIMTNIVLPQALKNAIPTIGNEFIVNIKDSSVLNVITVSELFMAGKIAATTYMTIEAYTIVALIYLSLTLIFSKLLKIVEKKLESDGVNEHKKVKVKTVTFDD